MHSGTGDLYTTAEAAALDAKTRAELVFLTGPEESIKKVSDAVKAHAALPNRAKRRAKAKAARVSRKRNRG